MSDILQSDAAHPSSELKKIRKIFSCDSCGKIFPIKKRIHVQDVYRGDMELCIVCAEYLSDIDECGD